MKKADSSPRRWCLVAMALLAAGPALALEVPYLSGRIVDEAGMVPPEVRQRLEEKLAAFEAETGAQVAVLTVPSLEGEVLEDFSLRVAETWKLGRAEQDDGVLFLVARDDRKMRIEVGYGLEGRLTDLQSGRILSDMVRPLFRGGDFGGGIEVGVDAILGILRGDPSAIVEAPPAAASGGGSSAGDWVGRIFGGTIFLLVVGVHSMVALGTPGVGGWFLYLFLMVFWAAFPAALVSPATGVATWLGWAVGFPFLRIWLGKTKAGKRLVKERPWLKNFSGGGGTWFKSSGGGGGSWSSGGGGGFSGGGGSFGGGGASSSW